MTWDWDSAEALGTSWFGNSSKWDPSKAGCNNTHVWELGPELEIYNPSMLVSAGLGMLTGFGGFAAIRRGKYADANVHLMYMITFFTFGCMNTSGLINFCFFDNQNPKTISQLHRYVLSVDGTFSSLTSLNFFLCALSDYKILKIKDSMLSQLIVALCAVGIALSYYLSMFNSWVTVWKFLYMDLTSFCSSAYFLLTLGRMAAQRNCVGLPELLASITVGLTGLRMLQMYKIEEYFCTWLGGYFTGMDVWYLQSDASLALLLAFYFAREKAEESKLRDSPSVYAPLLDKVAPTLV